jgi:hypothetical protein
LEELSYLTTQRSIYQLFPIHPLVSEYHEPISLVTVVAATVSVILPTVVVTVTTFAFAVKELGGDGTGTIDMPPPSEVPAAFGIAIVRVETGLCEAVTMLGSDSVGEDAEIAEDCATEPSVVVDNVGGVCDWW